MTTVSAQRFKDVISKNTGISDFTVDSVIKSKLTRLGNTVQTAGQYKGQRGLPRYNSCIKPHGSNYFYSTKELIARYEKSVKLIDGNGFTLGNYVSNLKDLGHDSCIESELILFDELNSRITNHQAEKMGISANSRDWRVESQWTNTRRSLNIRDYFRLNTRFFPELKPIVKPIVQPIVQPKIIDVIKVDKVIPTIQEKTMTTITEKQNEVLEKEILIDDNIIDSSVLGVGVLVFGIMGYLLYSSRGKL